ncbi:MAG: type I toxin-antitoxin system SymE family toxin [Clostridiales bacterium]|nr:type I toxin-antitoxin system SymE family toxin [Clostridiales bacterium]
MRQKENRNLTVGYASGRNYKETPVIRLQGQWLKELGFDIGNHVNVECQGGRLIITKEDEVIVE